MFVGPNWLDSYFIWIESKIVFKGMQCVKVSSVLSCMVVVEHVVLHESALGALLFVT